MVAAGGQFSLALEELGKVFAWGSGKNGVLGFSNGNIFFYISHLHIFIIHFLFRYASM